LTGGSGWIYWSSAAGEAQRARVTFVDVSEDSSGLGFFSNVAPPEGVVCWALPDGGKAMPCGVRHVEKTENGYRVGASLDFEDNFVAGQGSSRVVWVDDRGVVQSIPAAVENSGQALVELGAASNVPARQMLFLEGPQYGCLAVCRGSRPDGSRYILVAEAASDSFVTGATAA
jgi:hypothetical protein